MIILIVGICASFYLGWTLGANALANVLGPSVGGGGLTIRRAILLGGVATIAGSVLVGQHVTGTIQKGIVDFSDVTDGYLIVIAMISALLGAAIWSTVATYFGMPISISHSVVGAMVGIGIVTVGFDHVYWDGFAKIGASWVLSPLSGAVVCYLLFLMIKHLILDSSKPIQRSKLIAPWLIGIMVFILLTSLMYQGLPSLGFDKLSLSEVLVIAGFIAIIVTLLSYLLYQRVEPKGDDNHGKVEHMFISMLIISTIFISFAQGSHNVANAVGPLIPVINFSMFADQGVTDTSMGSLVITGVLVFGGVAMTVGVATWGYKVIQTIGSGITKLTASRAFTALFGSAITILLASRLGFPISSSHITVGGVIGVGLAGGLEALDRRVVRNIIVYIVLTVPMAAIIAIGIYFGISFFV